ncbi:MHYT domain-containing protein [Cellvibrio sp.]|uniref:MHYT domain-containing protein n=1 Tax=Cellvibrio sp. TaxID=1965322 RepID=UPI0039647B52
MEMDVSYNWFLVSLSFLVAVFGSFTGLQITNGMKSSSNGPSLTWIIAAAASLGGGAIWTMHFIGMLAYQTPMDIGYLPGPTFASLALAVVAVGIGVFIAVSGRLSPVRLLGAGLFTGLAVAGMHYLGMEAMVMPGTDMVYDKTLVGVSLVIAIVAATVALWLAVNLKGTSIMLGSAVVMAIAVCGMHYTGMAAMSMVHNHDADQRVIENSLSPMTMGLFIFCASMLLLVICLIMSLNQLSNKNVDELLDEPA